MDDIKTSFRKLALVHHPDRNDNSDEAKVTFQIINNAHEILSSPEKRREYDTYLKTSSVIEAKRKAQVKTAPKGLINLENLCAQFNYIFWEIEDILTLLRKKPDDRLYSGHTLIQWILKILVFMDKWVFEPSGHMDYFYRARNIDGKRSYDSIEDEDKYRHRPYADIYDYFYEMRKRVDRFINTIRVADVLKKMGGRDVKLIDNIFEAHLLSYHYLGMVNLILKGEASSVAPFIHSNECYDEEGRGLIDFKK
ncbi:MAG: J domain-containing protein [Spirochaetales bacterium]|nr:J domain-containing protein [Spirochaetales bacterium]